MGRAKRKPHHRTELGGHFSEGARKIWTRLAEKKIAPHQFATDLGWSRSAIFKYMHGDQKPDRTRSLVIEKELGIDPADFDKKPVREFSLAAAKAA
jgi:transcriptional regulator with XRE-family HTH domain